MPKKKTKKSTRSKTQPSGQNTFMLFILGVALLLGAYLYGKVQIHVDLKKIDKIHSETRTLRQKRDNLRIRVNTLKGYQYIVAEAKKQGLVFLKSDNVDKVFVYAKTEAMRKQKPNKAIVCAGMTF